MAPGQPVADFNAFINANRQRRRNESLAQEIFGKGRRASAPGAGTNNNRKPGLTPSLASRVGVAKRTASTAPKSARASPRPSAGNVDAEWTHDLHALNNPSAVRASPFPPRGPKSVRNNRGDRLHSALTTSASSPALHSQFNIIGVGKPTSSISIRGLAGPYPVVAKNLARGTTAADIESAMVPVGGVLLSCVIIAERPKVIAELVFETKEGADNVVETFNNQNADGNVINVYHKSGPISSLHKLTNSYPTPAAPATPSIPPLGPRTNVDRSEVSRSAYGGTDRYIPQERRRDQNRDEVLDGSQGFEDKMETDDANDNRIDKNRGQGLYSDNMIGSNRGRGRRSSRDRGRVFNR